VAVFTFNISEGTLSGPDETWTGIFSGHGVGYNNPADVAQKGVGPLPPGLYRCGFLEASHPVLGPSVMALTQIQGESFGRGSFYVHGASAVHPELSSDGCIIVPRAQRIAMDAAMTVAKDRNLLVIAGTEQNQPESTPSV
jgi:hypothetical protein